MYLYLIDGAPPSLQSALQLLGNEDEFEVNLLSRVFNSHDSQVCSVFSHIENENIKYEICQVLKKLQSEPNWKQRVDHLLNTFDGDQEDKQALEDGLLILRNRLQDALNYKPDGNLINGINHLIRPNDCSQYDNCELTLVSFSLEIIEFEVKCIELFTVFEANTSSAFGWWRSHHYNNQQGHC